MPKPLGGITWPFNRGLQLEPALLELASRLAARLRPLRATRHFNEIIAIVCDDVRAGRVIAARRYLEHELAYWNAKCIAHGMRENRHAI